MDPYEDIQKTGTIGIGNERVNIAKDAYEPLRLIILVRNPNLLHFSLYENEIHRFKINAYVWSQNRNGKLEGREKDINKHIVTWQPHGFHFIITHYVTERIKFMIKRPPVLEFDRAMKQVGYQND